MDVDFEAAQTVTTKQGKVVASYKPIKALEDPKYYSHFTIAKILPEGTLQTLNFESGSHVDMGLGSTWSGMLKRPLDIDEGHYMLVTGTRMAKGSVLAEITFFNVARTRSRSSATSTLRISSSGPTRTRRPACSRPPDGVTISSPSSARARSRPTTRCATSPP